MYDLGHEWQQPTPAFGARLFSWNSGNLIKTFTLKNMHKMSYRSIYQHRLK